MNLTFHFKNRVFKIVPKTRIIYYTTSTNFQSTNGTDWHCYADKVKINIFKGKDIKNILISFY